MVDLFYHLLDPGTSSPETLSSQEQLKLKRDAMLILLTSEQRTILNMAEIVRSRDNVRIIAYVGNGKTTTLVKFTRRNPDNRSSINHG